MENTSNKKDKIIRISILTILLLLIGVMIYVTISYAYWQKEYNQEKENTLQSGCFSYKFTDENSINLENAYPMSESDAMKLTPYTFTIENNCSIDMFYNVTLNTTGTSDLDSSLRYKLLNDDVVVGTDIISNLKTYNEYNNFTYTDEAGDYNIINSYILDKGTLSSATMNDDNTEVVEAGESITYNLYLWIDENVDNIEIMAKSFEGKIIVTSQTDTFSKIKKAYTYNQTAEAANYCVTGDEATCQETTCYESTDANSCTSGTIVDYKVNNNETVRFHVMYDNGATMTMQSQKNTIYNIAWLNGTDYAEANVDKTECAYDSCNDEGPITILNALESKTSEWKNVNPQIYSLGTTIFKINEFTDCSSYSSCTANTYTLNARTANARMITVQEAEDLGCTGTNQSCPIWLYNYLYFSENYGGTKNDTKKENNGTSNAGYWTINTASSYANGVWRISYFGNIYRNNTYDINSGARAVVEINK